MFFLNSSIGQFLFACFISIGNQYLIDIQNRTSYSLTVECQDIVEAFQCQDIVDTQGHLTQLIFNFFNLDFVQEEL
jgi:hypothetical protein